MESIRCYGQNPLKVHTLFVPFCFTLEEVQTMPLLTFLWQNRRGLSISTSVLLQFHLWQFSAASQTLWCFVGKQISYLWSGHFSLSLTPWLCNIYAYPITVVKSFVTTLQILLFYIVSFKAGFPRASRRWTWVYKLSTNSLVLYSIFCNLIHFLHISIYFIKNLCGFHYKN